MRSCNGFPLSASSDFLCRASSLDATLNIYGQASRHGDRRFFTLLSFSAKSPKHSLEEGVNRKLMLGMISFVFESNSQDDSAPAEKNEPKFLRRTSAVNGGLWGVVERGAIMAPVI